MSLDGGAGALASLRGRRSRCSSRRRRWRPRPVACCSTRRLPRPASRDRAGDAGPRGAKPVVLERSPEGRRSRGAADRARAAALAAGVRDALAALRGRAPSRWASRSGTRASARRASGSPSSFPGRRPPRRRTATLSAAGAGGVVTIALGAGTPSVARTSSTPGATACARSTPSRSLGAAAPRGGGHRGRLSGAAGPIERIYFVLMAHLC